MNKCLIRCYRGYAIVGSRHNEEVLYTLPSGYSNKDLYSCVSCGELFSIDQEAVHHTKHTIKSVIRNLKCPSCSSKLSESLKPYPATFLASDGSIGHYQPERRIPPDSESLIKEVWDLYSILENKNQ